MALASSFLILVLCGYGVQGSNVDLASALQTRMDHHAQAPWKAQTQAFIGLLQSMGKQVPADKQANTRTLLDQLITLLTTTSSSLKTTSTNGVAKIKSDSDGFITKVNEYDTLAKQAKTVAQTKSGILRTCYQELRVQEANYEGSCNYAGSLLEEGLEQPYSTPAIPSCLERDAATNHTFTVSKQFKWTCSFTAGEDATSCTGADSELKKDLKANKALLKAAGRRWVILDKKCKDDTEIEKTKCDDQVVDAGNKRAQCARIFQDTSELLCDFNTYVHTREEFLTSLKGKINEAKNMTAWKEEKRQWIDLQLIICVLQRFKANMNFAQDDFSKCTAETANAVFVDEPAVPVSPTLMSIRNIAFGGGLADKYLGQPNVRTGTPMPASAGRQVTIDVHQDATEPKLYLKLADASDGESCNIAESAKNSVAVSNLGAAKQKCAESSSCKFFELGGGNSRMGSAECIPQADSTNQYTILRKVCKGGVHFN